MYYIMVKQSRRKSKRLQRKSRKTRKQGKQGKQGKQSKQIGGMCYGRGVGANSYDPNFSVYNTRELQLFPYKQSN